MKTKAIIGLLVLAVCVGILITTLGGTSSYASFKESMDSPGRDFHVVGSWEKSKGIEYNPEKDPNYFSFYMKDTLGAVKKVIYHNEKPEGFERVDRLVLVGHTDDKSNVFEAGQILMKCPSKYNEVETSASKKD